MLNVQSVLNELRNQRRRTQAELKRLDRAIAALRPLSSGNPDTERGRGIKRTLSAAARKRISQAQKARWAKIRRQKAAKA